MGLVITLGVLVVLVGLFKWLSSKSIVTKFLFWSGVLLLLVLYAGGKSIWNNQFTQTKDFTYWQATYRQFAIDIATDPIVKKNNEGLAVGVVTQYTLQQYPFYRSDGTTQQRVDRCQSCHTGLENPGMTAENIIKEEDHVTVSPADVPKYLTAHPQTRDLVYVLGAHPGKSAGVTQGGLAWQVATGSSPSVADSASQTYDAELMGKHSFAIVGCTTCHYGDGRELVESNAHGHNEFWLAQLLPSKYMDAACAQCHTKYTKDFTPDYSLHPLPLDVVQAAAGDKYKDAATLTAEDVPAFLNKHPELKPTVNMAQQELSSLSTISRGAQIFHQNACWGCHKIEGFSKGNVGPELTQEGLITTPTAIARQLWDPRYKVNGCVMPYFFSRHIVPLNPNDPLGPKNEAVLDSYGKFMPLSKVAEAQITDQETMDGLQARGYVPDAAEQPTVDALVTFVYSQTGLNYSQSPSARSLRLTQYDSAQPPTVAVSAAEGKQLFDTSGCNACHYRGDPNNPKSGRGGIAGPNLSWEGGRHSQQWIVEHYKNPQEFVPKSIMPVFPFSDSQRAALTLYDVSAIPKGARPVSEDQDMPTKAMSKDDIMVPQVRYMTR